ncbi:hypothetical protein Hanom_Chr04g00292841 [Helianthus anomalus]
MRFMAEIVVFYDFVHFVGKMDFVANSHPPIAIQNTELGFLFLSSYHPNSCLSPSHFRNHSSSSSSLHWRSDSLSSVSRKNQMQ